MILRIDLKLTTQINILFWCQIIPRVDLHLLWLFVYILFLSFHLIMSALLLASKRVLDHNLILRLHNLTGHRSYDCLMPRDIQVRIQLSMRLMHEWLHLAINFLLHRTALQIRVLLVLRIHDWLKRIPYPGSHFLGRLSLEDRVLLIGHASIALLLINHVEQT